MEHMDDVGVQQTERVPNPNPGSVTKITKLAYNIELALDRIYDEARCIIALLICNCYRTA
jgi:hypothetical protein